jgi:RHS repeat-associated protein
VPDVVLSSGYDAAGNRSSSSATIAGTADFLNSYSYNTLSQLVQIVQQGQNGGNTVAPKEIDYKLDAIGDVTGRSGYNFIGIGPRYDIASEAISYNPLGLLDNISMTSHAGQVNLDNLTYSYDTLARVSTFGSIDGTATYGYDPTSQLTSATYSAASGKTEPPNLLLAFDKNGNRSTVNGASTTISPNNEVTNDGTFTYQFDADGNRTVRTRISTAYAPDRRTTYAWDYRNRLTDVETFDNNGVLTQHVHYAYDVWDHIIERDVDPNGSGSYAQTFHYVWDASAPPSLGPAGQPPSAPGSIVLAFNGPQQLTARYLNGPNTSAYDQFFSTLAEEDVTSTTSAGPVSFFLLDAEGTLTDIANSNGALADHLEYNPFGQLFSESNPSVPHLDGYAGGLYDSSTGLVYFIERWYDPQGAVWISADPTGFAGGDLNETRYVANNTAGAIDPSGLVLVAVDGTGSKEYLRKTGVDENGRYKSHVRNFYQDYKPKPGETKYYYHGPDSTIQGAADECRSIYNGIMSRVKKILEAHPDEVINLVGHSRGGYILMEVARDLKRQGYRVNFLGLYDAVDSAPGFGSAETIPSNVDYCSHAYSHWAAKSRGSFNRADHGPEDRSKMKDFEDRAFVGTHSAIGGAPWDGDRPRGMTPDQDAKASAEADAWMRAKAKAAGVPLRDGN